MMSGWDLDDWIIMALVVLIMLAGTVYLFLHPAAAVFAAWCGLVTTVTGVFHFMRVKDDKEKDSC